MDSESEIKKVDSKGRIILPRDWLKSVLGSNKEVIIIKTEGFLKIFPKKHKKMSEFFDSVEFGNEIMKKIEDWTEIEREIYN